MRDRCGKRVAESHDELKTRGKKLGEVDLAEMDKIWDRIKNDETRMTNAEGMTKSE